MANWTPRDEAILPVALEDLFPYIIPVDSEPVYYESIDSEFPTSHHRSRNGRYYDSMLILFSGASDSVPNNSDLEDPNEQPFGEIGQTTT